MGDPKYKNRTYRSKVRMWIAGLRAADRKAEHEQQFRNDVLRTGVLRRPHKKRLGIILTENLCDLHSKLQEGSNEHVEEH